MTALLSVPAAYAVDGSAAAPILNSERIERRFGSYGVEILAQSDAGRATCLYSEDAGGRTCRTLALVEFADELPAGLDAAIDAVRAGASLGATLESRGFRPVKVNRWIGELRLAPEPPGEVGRLLGIAAAALTAVHLYELRASKAAPGGSESVVATILEIHHPDYLELTDLQRIYRTLDTEPPVAVFLARWLEAVGGYPRLPPWLQ